MPIPSVAIHPNVSQAEQEQLDNIWEYKTHPAFSEAERVALDFSLLASQVPNAVDETIKKRLYEHWDELQQDDFAWVNQLLNWEENEHKIAGHVSESAGYNPAQSGNTARPIGTALLGLRFDKDLAQPQEDHASEDHSHGDHGHTHGAKAGVSTGYLLPFEIVSVHLLVVLVGAAYLARAKRRNVAVS